MWLPNSTLAKSQVLDQLHKRNVKFINTKHGYPVVWMGENCHLQYKVSHTSNYKFGIQIAQGIFLFHIINILIFNFGNK